MRAQRLFRGMALTGFLGLIVSILIWNAFLAPSGKYPVALVLMLLLVPLMIPLRGLLYGRRYTHAWVSMLALFYFALGVADAYSDPVDRWYGVAVTAFSLMLFAGSIFYVRLSARHDSKT